jgi:two-component system sensor histidine kinase UhpB
MKELKILYLEDSASDAEIVERTLKDAGIDFSLKLVDKKDEFIGALKEYRPDLVLSDHSMYQFNSVEALNLFKAFNLAIPFILVTGTVSEEFAVNILKQGADDYLLKDNLTRLPTAIHNSIEKYRLDRERRKYVEDIIANETLMNEAEHLAHFGSWEADAVSGDIKWSDEVFRIYGYEPGEVKPGHDIILHHIHPADRSSYQHAMYSLLKELDTYASEFRIIDKNGQNKFLFFRIVVKRDSNGQLTRLLGFMQDITERKKVEESLRESNERHEFVNKATLDTIWEWNFITSTGLWGEGIIKTFGYTKDQVKYDESWLEKYLHPDERERVIEKLNSHIENVRQNWQDEYRFRCADGSYKYVYDRGFILYDEKGNPHRMIGAMTDITEKRRLETELAEQALYQQKLITEITIQAQEKERNELGRELHDNINQLLATVKLYLAMAKEKENLRQELLGRCYLHVTDAMEEIRKLSKTLVAPSLGDIGLHDTLRQLIDEINHISSLQIQLIDEMPPGQEIDKALALMLYRIVQEQTNNIVKYARANQVIIKLKMDNDKVYLSIIDNGVGFDTAAKAKGIGLKNISSRVEFYQGNMKIISAPGKGCALEISIPV